MGLRRRTGSRFVTRVIAAVALVALAGCSESPLPDDELTPARAETVVRVVDAGDVLQGAQIPTLDPSTMVEAEIKAVVGSDKRCEFRYTTAGRPVVVLGTGPEGQPMRGVVKLTGDLVALAPAAATGDNARAFTLTAGGIELIVRPEAEDQSWTVQDDITRREANLHFRVRDDLDVGYRGYFDCGTRLSAIAYEH